MTNINDSSTPKFAEAKVEAADNDAVASTLANGKRRNAGATNRTDVDTKLPTGEEINASQFRDESKAMTVPSSTGKVQAHCTTTEKVLSSETAADGAGCKPVCGIYADDDNRQPGDLEEQEEEVEENVGQENRATNAVNASESFRLGPGAFRIFPTGHYLRGTAATRRHRSGGSELTEHIDIDSELLRLGIPMAEAKLVTTPEESEIPIAESLPSPTLPNATAGIDVTSTVEADNIYQAEYIPTINLCGKEMKRSAATLVVGIAALFVAMAVGVSVSVRQNENDAIATKGKMDQEEAARRSRMTDAVTAFAKRDLSNPNLSHGQALEWMLGPENAHLDVPIPGTKQSLMTKQRFAMALFYYTTGGGSWFTKDEFLSEEHICDWSTMIVCANEKNNQEVKELQFGNNNLQGALPQELLYLDTLKTLNLTGNSGLAGTLPPEIGEIASLEILDLHDAKFVGTIPESFVNLRNLQHLDLSNNFLQGGLEYKFVGSSVIGSLRELRHLDLSGNLFDQAEPNALLRLTRLEYLDISNNELGNSGDHGYKFGASMPSTIGALANLKVFNAANNNFGGTIHPNIAKCKRLEVLRLSGNSYINGIPTEVGRLKALRVLDLSNNVGLGGSIPSSLMSCKKLKHLNLKNSGIAGSIPKEFGRGMNMDTLILDVNFLTGRIPREIFNMQKLRELRLASNSLEGSIPVEVGNATELLQLTLFENSLEGPLPSEIGNLVNLISLNLGWNGLNSSLPETLGNLVNLETLIFDDNLFTGQLPTALGNLKNLREIHLTKNSFNGTLPSELGSLTALEDVGLSGNEFTGTIPKELGNLGNIWSLRIGGNSFSGTVPGWIGKSKLAQSLTHFEVSSTNLEGTLPAEWAMLSSLKKLKIHRNPLITGTIPLEWANITKLDGMWMFNTSLSGSVSHLCRKEFADFGLQDCEDCGLKVDLEEVECECCNCCIDNKYMESDDDAYGDGIGNKKEGLDEDNSAMGST